MEENVIQINGGITINVDVTAKKSHVCEKDYVWNPATCNSENVKHLSKYYGWFSYYWWWGNKNYFKKFYKKKVTCKTQNFYILLGFLLIILYHFW